MEEESYTCHTAKTTWQQMAEENLHNLLIKKLQPQF